MLQAGVTTPLHAAPSQVPLLNRPNLTPPANLMFTLDDSGSMTYQYLPEKSFELNGYTVNFPDDGKIYLHPKELDVNRFTFKTPNTDSGYRDNRFVTAAPHEVLSAAMVLLQSQMRSPQVNRLYYNPYIRYLPWKTSDGRSYANASPSKAWLLPSYLSPSAVPPEDPTQYVSLTTSSEHLVYWYCRNRTAWSYCESGDAAYVTLKYNPALLYMLREGANPNDSANYTPYDLNAEATFSWPESEASARTECSLSSDKQSRICTREQELQNFANWFVFYRSRLFVAQGKIPEALVDSLGDVRLGWGTIHPRKTGQSSPEWGSFTPDDDLNSTANRSPSVQQGVRMLNEAHLLKFTNWLRNLTTERRTPTLHAVYSVGEYFKRTDALSPWQNDLPRNDNTTSPLACRRSYHLVVTDGYYQTDSEFDAASDNMFRNVFTALNMGLPDIGNVDETSTADTTATNPQQATFPGLRSSAGTLLSRNAFRDGLSGTLADHAMRLWLTDLQPDIDDRLKPIEPKRNPDLPATAPSELVKEVHANPATWQHLTHYMVGFGVNGTLASNDTTLERMLTPGSTVSWPSTLNKVDDLWHAAVNSRGEYFSASNPEELQESLRKALGNTGPQIRSEAGLATSGTELQDTNVKYVPNYDAQDWTGDVKAIGLNASGNETGLIWSANDHVPQPALRNIVIMQSDGESRGARPFVHAQLDEATRTILDEGLVAHIRGAAVAAYRERSAQKRLPDFISSTPLAVKESLGFDYSSSVTVPGSNLFNEFKGKKNARADGVLLVGGNGGMLHGFSMKDGPEVFAFIPQAAVPKLPLIANKRYGRPDNPHHFVVDGQLTEADVYVGFQADGSPSPEWHNLVVGTMGAGGKSVYALTVPTQNPTRMGTDNVKWEVTHQDMGFITTPPQVGYTPQGWKVFVGNGVESDSGRTALLVIDVATGQVTSIPVDQGVSGQTQHGLGGVTLARNAAGVVNAVYAGDSRGRLWRFDVGQQAITVGYGGQPLFVARDSANNVQPIVAAPLLIRHPKGGQIIAINSGRTLYTTDVTTQSVQSAYGIWEKVAVNASTAGLVAPSPTRQQLTQQSIQGLREVQRINGTWRRVYGSTRNVVDWETVKGWYLDLRFPDTAGTSESFSLPKAIYDPIPLEDINVKNIVVSSVKPATSEPSCDNGEDRGYSVILDGLTGGASLVQLDINGDGVIDDGDGEEASYEYGGGNQRVLRRKRTTTSPPPDGPPPPPPPCTGMIANSNDGIAYSGECPGPDTTGGRRIQDRVWRQLLNPPAP